MSRLSIYALLAPRIAMAQVIRKALRTFPGNGRLSGDQLRKDAGGCGVPVGGANENSAATKPSSFGVTAYDDQQGLRSDHRSEVNALPAQPSPDQADFFALLKNPRFDGMAERSAQL